MEHDPTQKTYVSRKPSPPPEWLWQWRLPNYVVSFDRDRLLCTTPRSTIALSTMFLATVPAMLVRTSLTLLLLSLVISAEADDKQRVVVATSEFDTLQEAVDALPESGGIVFVTPGVYELTEPLRISTGDFTLRGSGASSHIKNMNENGKPAIVIENPKFSGKSTPNKERLWRVCVSDLRVTGNEKSGHGIQANYIEEIHIHDVTCSYHGGDGFHLNHCYEDPRVSDNLITYNKKNGIYLEGCHDIVVSANHFEENVTGLRCIDSFNLAMSGNNLDDHLGDGVIVENTYGSFISSNMIEECQGWAIILDRDVYGTTVSANVIAHDFAGGIDLRDAHGCAISANTFTIVKNVGLAVRKDSGSITVTGNNFSDSWLTTTEDGEELTKRDPKKPTKLEKNANEAGGILLEDCEAVVITGNLFSRLTTEDVVQKGECKEILIQANGSHRAK